jgi:OOP family OmpA-OmpF porin
VVAPPAPEPPAPAPLPSKIVLGDAILHFANNGAELSSEGSEAIKAVAQQLKAYQGDYSLVVGGHTSSLGSKAHNKALSLRRAESVAMVLIDSGIPASKVYTEGFGPDKPVADNKTREGQSRNRRVEIDVRTPETVEKIHTDTGTVDVPAQPKTPAKAKAPAKAAKPSQAKPKP